MDGGLCYPKPGGKDHSKQVSKLAVLPFSPPEQLHSDQGKQFESDLLKEICKLLHVEKTRTTPYHPQCDGLIERFNRTLLSMLATSVKGQTHLIGRSSCQKYAWHTTQVSSHQQAILPFNLMFGRQARIPIDLMFNLDCQPEMEPNEHVAELRKTFNSSYNKVREKMDVAHERQREYYNQKVHGTPYQVGDLVWLHSTVTPKGKSKKLNHPWTGPYLVVKNCLM